MTFGKADLAMMRGHIVSRPGICGVVTMRQRGNFTETLCEDGRWRMVSHRQLLNDDLLSEEWTICEPIKEGKTL